MKFLITFVLILFLCKIEGANIAVTTDTSSLYDEDVQIPTTSIPELGGEADCVTRKAEPGKCTTFSDCFSLLLQDNLPEERKSNRTNGINFDGEIYHYSALEDELFETSRSDLCPVPPVSKDGKMGLPVCCKLEHVQSEEILNDDEDSAIPDASTSSVFPSNCGKSNGVFSPSGFQYWIKKSEKVTGGRNASPGQFPWMVAIFGKNGKITCGASLVNNEFVLTAAHCLSTYNSNDILHLRVHIGDYNIMSLKDGPHQVRRISKIILHKRFNINNYHNDIALMKLDKPVTFTDNIQPICFPQADFNKREVEGKNIIVTGWGRDRQWGYESSILRMVEMPVWKFEECQKVFNVFAPNRLLESLNICAGDGKRSKDACIGDSGGPLIYNIGSRWTQLGIVSWGKGCGSFPGVYSSTLAFVPWMEKNMRNN